MSTPRGLNKSRKSRDSRVLGGNLKSPLMDSGIPGTPMPRDSETLICMSEGDADGDLGWDGDGTDVS